MLKNQAKITETKHGKFIVTLLNGDKNMAIVAPEFLHHVEYVVQSFALTQDYEAFEDCYVAHNGNLVALINERDELLANILRAFAIGYISTL